jgi:S-adenosyl methyltransferase
VLRSRAQISGFFDGFDLAEPGLVQVPLWRPERKPPGARDLKKIAIYGGVGRKAETTSAQFFPVRNGRSPGSAC